MKAKAPRHSACADLDAPVPLCAKRTRACFDLAPGCKPVNGSFLAVMHAGKKTANAGYKGEHRVTELTAVVYFLEQRNPPKADVNCLQEQPPQTCDTCAMTCAMDVWHQVVDSAGTCDTCSGFRVFSRAGAGARVGGRAGTCVRPRVVFMAHVPPRQRLRHRATAQPWRTSQRTSRTRARHSVLCLSEENSGGEGL